MPAAMTRGIVTGSRTNGQFFDASEQLNMPRCTTRVGPSSGNEILNLILESPAALSFNSSAPFKNHTNGDPCTFVNAIPNLAVSYPPLYSLIVLTP